MSGAIATLTRPAAGTGRCAATQRCISRFGRSDVDSELAAGGERYRASPAEGSPDTVASDLSAAEPERVEVDSDVAVCVEREVLHLVPDECGAVRAGEHERERE